MTESGKTARSAENSAMGRGIGLRSLNWIFIAVIVFIAAILIYISVRTNYAYTDVKEANDLYVVCQKSASDMKLGSDYLTDQVRLFVITGDREYMDNYFEEANTIKRRDKALETIKKEFGDTKAYTFLSEAMENSVNLMDIEYRAMKLMTEGSHVNPIGVPEEVTRYELSEKDLALSDDAKKEKARDILFDYNYKKYKTTINYNVDSSLASILEKTKTRVSETSEKLTNLFRMQFVLIGALIIVCLLIVYFYAHSVIGPIKRCINQIEDNKHMPVEGAREIRYLANSYNVIFDETSRNREKLSYEASHDVLTGVYNRSAFDTILKEQDEKDICFMLADVDHFKNINDTYGHGTGDKVLRRVAGLFVETFRSEDKICRIGGDEFVIIMVHVNSSLKSLVSEKLEGINYQLQHPKDDLPPVSLSIGIAVGDREDPDGDIYADADKALYRVKERGRNGYEFF